jgi:TonB family protein
MSKRARTLRGAAAGLVLTLLPPLRAAAQVAPPAASGEPPSAEPTAPAAPPAAEPSPAQPPAEAAAPAAPATPATSATPGVVVPPRLLEEVRPEYPARAQAERIAASVTLELDIDVTGAVTRSSVLEPAQAVGHGFDEAALAAAAKLRFEPARLDGAPIAVRIHYQLHFVPGVGAPPPDSTAAAAPAPAPQAPASPSGELSGTLIERGTRRVLPGVKVTVFRGTDGDAVGFETETDSAGHFRFVGLTSGPWQILADPEGYYPVRERETVAEGQRLDVSYLIERSSYNPYDVVVDAKRVRREVTRHSIDTAQADRMPGTFGDVLAVVKNFPGVARVPFGQGGGLVIRGSAPEDSKQFIDGMEIPQVYHFGGLRSVLTVGMTDHIDFYPSNFSAQYGRATGGITDVGLTPLKLDAAHGYADISVFDTSLFLAAPLSDEVSIAVGGRRSYIDVVLGELLPNSGSGTVAPRYYDAQALLRWRPAPEQQLSAFFMVSDDAFRLILDEPADGDAETIVSQLGFFSSFYRVLAEHRYVPSTRWENRLQLSFGRERSRFEFGELNVDVRIGTGQVRDTWRYAFSDAFALSTGVDYLLEQVDGAGELPALPREGDAEQQPDVSESSLVDLEGTYHTTAGFLELEWRPFEGTLVLPSLRAEHFSRTAELRVSPRLLVRQTLTDELTLKAGVGHYVQEPEFLETDAAVGNPDLGLKQAIHYSAGFEYRPLPFLTVDVTAFYKTLWDQVSRTDAVIERDGTLQPANLDNNGRGRVRGLELSLKHELTHGLFAWLAYTLSRAERKDSGGTGYRPFDYDQTHILTAVASYRLPRNWEVSTRFRYVTGNVYTPFQYGVFDADADEYIGVTGAANSARASAFHQLDLRVDKRWVFDGWMLGVYLDLQNVYNRANEDGVEYNYDYTSKQGNAGLPLIPVLGLRGEF